MLARLFRLYFPRVPAEIPLACDRAVAVRGLRRSLLSGWSLVSPDEDLDGVRGTVRATRVALHRVQGMPRRKGGLKGNSWKPWLFARFERSEGTVYLRGAFRMHPFVVAFSLFWLLFALSAALASTWILVFGPPSGIDEPMPLSIPATAWALFLVGSVAVPCAWRWSEDDMAFLERFVRESAAEEAERSPEAERADTAG